MDEGLGLRMTKVPEQNINAPLLWVILCILRYIMATL